MSSTQPKPMVYVVPNPKNVLTATKQSNSTQNKPKLSQLVKLDILTTFPKQLNIVRDMLPLLWWLGNRLTMEGTTILKDNASRSKAG